MKPSDKYRVILIEPSEIIREGIRLLMEKDSRFRVTACFSDIQSFENKLPREDAPIIFLNPAMIQFNKGYHIRDLFADYPAGCLIAVLYQYVDPELLQDFDGILNIYDEGRKIPQKILAIVEATHPKNDRTEDGIELSNREKDILIALAQGLTNKEIADQLHISAHTVISHRKNIVRKTGIKTVSGLTLYALFNNLVSQTDLL